MVLVEYPETWPGLAWVVRTFDGDDLIWCNEVKYSAAAVERSSQAQLTW